MIVLDYQDRRPIYEQVTDKFQILILNGVLPPGSQMPSVRQLATELSVNPNTIQRAYMELEKLGLIYPVKGTASRYTCMLYRRHWKPCKKSCCISPSD